MHTRTLRHFAAAATLLPGLAVMAALIWLPADASAAPWGTPVGRGNVKSVIDSPGDVDSFLIEAHAGARIDLRIGVPRSSDLVPQATLVGPDGPLGTAQFAAAGRGLELRAFVAPVAARYEIRIAGDGASSGAYSLRANVKGSARIDTRGVRIDAGAERAFPFAAGGGGSVTFSVGGRNQAPSLVRIEDPSGRAIVVAPESVRRTSSRLTAKRLALPDVAPYGAWRLVVEATTGTLDDLRVKIRVKGGALETLRGKLIGPEPTLLSVTPDEAGAGGVLTLAGTGLAHAKKRSLRVFVGGREATDVVVSGPTRVTAHVPEGATGVVDVGVLDGSGHALVLRDAFEAVPPPRPTSFSPRRGPASGGTVVHVLGQGFRTSSAVTIAGTVFAAQTEYVSPTELRFETPEYASGPQTIGVVDPTGQSGIAPATFEFVAPPIVLSVQPALVPRLLGERVALVGGNFASSQSVTIAGVAAVDPDVADANRFELTVPTLDPGRHDVEVSDDLGQTTRVPEGLAVFDFVAGPAADLADAGRPTACGLFDVDDDGDLDLVIATEGGASIEASSRLRLLLNDGDRWTDVTAALLPDVVDDDWRAGSIAFGDVAGDVGSPAPDGWPDVVIGTLDTTALGATRSRIRILANRAAPGGGRMLVDRTDAVMAGVSAYDDWRAADLWIGDLDGDGGIADIVATHDEIPFGETPLAPYYVSHLSGTRVFTFVDGDGSEGGFAHDAARLPTTVGTRLPTSGFPTCIGDSCEDDHTPFRGVALAVADLDADGRLDVAVTSPGTVIRDTRTISSTQIARNVDQNGDTAMLDRTSFLNPALSPFSGEILLAGDVTGDATPDLVVVRNAAEGAGLAITVARGRGFDGTWSLASTSLLPEADGDERLQAVAAELVDVDGDGDLDLVLVAATPPSTGTTTTGRGLRVLRNVGGSFSRQLETLLPAATVTEDWSGEHLAVGDLAGDGGLGLVLVRTDDAGTGVSVRTVVRTLSD